MNKKWLVIPAAVALLFGAQAYADEMPATGGSAGANAKSPEEQRQAVRAVTKDTLETVYKKHPTAKDAIAKSAGYAVFNNGSATILFAGAGGGEGLAVNQSDGHEIFMRMVQVKGGLGLGIKNTRLVLIFPNKEAFHKFVTKGWVFGGEAGASAKAGDTGGGFEGARAVGEGVYAYQFTENGADAEVTVSGTKYYVDKDLNKGKK
ncbi:YSC84-related protein [Silvimonas soli]|uniref:lipid-binding SYLF domain-containing protein n=1 Tax=Silvimonas soli TaxID=2980100 RepID=UPI0024B3A0A9|nr:YSC84-related protein [Silvimonas soli]